MMWHTQHSIQPIQNNISVYCNGNNSWDNLSNDGHYDRFLVHSPIDICTALQENKSHCIFKSLEVKCKCKYNKKGNNFFLLIYRWKWPIKTDLPRIDWNAFEKLYTNTNKMKITTPNCPIPSIKHLPLTVNFVTCKIQIKKELFTRTRRSHCMVLIYIYCFKLLFGNNNGQIYFGNF